MAHWLQTIPETLDRLAARRWAYIAIFIVTAFGLMLGFLTVAYATNDDPLMSMIVSGTAASVAPDEHLVHTHYWIGLALKALYSSFPNVAWYGGYLVLVHIAAHAAMAYMVSGDLYTRRRYSVYVIYLAVVEAYLLTHLQFTSTAFLAAQSGALLTAVCLYRQAIRSRQSLLLPLLAGAGLMIVGGLIRERSCYLAILLAIPAVLGLILYSRGARRVWVPAALVYASVLLAVASSWQLNQRYYDSDPRWRGFYQYNALRVKFNDYLCIPYTAETEPAFRQAGWSRRDHAMLTHWFYTDIEALAPEKLAQVARLVPQPLIRNGLGGCLQVARNVFEDAMPLLFVTVLAYWLTARSAWNHRIQLATFLLAVLITLGITVLVKVPPAHVFVPILSFSLALAVILPERIGRDRATAFSGMGLRASVIVAKRAAGPKSYVSFSLPLTPLCLVLCVVALSAEISTPLHVYHQYRRSRTSLHREKELKTIVERLSGEPDQLVVAWGTAFPLEHVLPLRSLQPYRGIHLLSLGWTQNTPINDAVKRAHGVEELPRDLYRRDDICLVSTPDLNRIWYRYARERFGVETQFDIEQANWRFLAGRMRLRRAEDAAPPDRPAGAIRTAAEALDRRLR